MRAVDVARAAVDAGLIVVPPAPTQRLNESATSAVDGAVRVLGGRLVVHALSSVGLAMLVPSRRRSTSL